jgi:DNA-directed RNA polymerase specialized sigma24 family protein
MVTEQRKDIVRRVLSELSEKEGQLLRRVFLEEEDKDSVCGQLHVDRAYLRVLLFRARHKFKIALDRANSNVKGAGGEI